MKYIAVAAALAGVAVADNNWGPVYTTKPKPVDPATTWTAPYDPDTWTPKYKTTKPVDPVTWETYKKPATTKSVDPAEWDTYVKPATTTKSQCAYVTEVPVKKCKAHVEGKPDYCWETKTKTTYYADSCTWSDWVDPVTKTYWSEVPVDVTKTETWSNVAVVTTVTPGWTKDGWTGPAWPAATDSCSSNVVTSYGAPTWKPVPDAPTKPAPAPVKETPYAPKPDAGKGYAPITPNGNKWSMTYTPYDAQGKCKTEEIIKTDMKNLAAKGFISVRVYSTKCDTLKFIGDACRANGLKMILGVFIDKYGVNGDYVKEQVKAIVEWKQWDIVELIVIGNEALYQNFCKAEDLVWLIEDCKKQFVAAGYTGHCTTTEPLSSWQKDGAKFCKVVDVVAANLYAYFNPETTCDKAGEFVLAEIEILAKICPGKETYVMESGWPSAGNCNGKACPGKEEQKKAIKSIQESCGGKVVFFSYENELWKEAGPYGVEQHWGCGDLFEATWDPVTVTSTTAASSTWAGWTTTTKPVDPTSTWAAY